MTMEWNAISYSLRILRPVGKLPSLRVLIVRMQSQGTSAGFITSPKVFLFHLPVPDMFPREVVGVSEVTGMVGGVPNPFLAATSEAIERALSDCVTATALSVLEAGKERPSDRFLVLFGPALPKMVGRLASLRPSDNVRIGWVSAPSLLNWMCEDTFSATQFPLRPDAAIHDLSGPQDARLLYTIATEVNREPLTLQLLNLHGNGQTAAKDLLENHPRLEMDSFLPGPLRVPQETAISIDVLDQWRGSEGDFELTTLRVARVTTAQPRLETSEKGWTVSFEATA